MGVNKPLKSKMADPREEWVGMEKMNDVAEIPAPTRKSVASWIVECY